MILIEVDGHTACINQVAVRLGDKCIHMRDGQSGFYHCMPFQTDDEMNRVFKYMSELIKDYVLRDRSYVAIECKLK